MLAFNQSTSKLNKISLHVRDNDSIREQIVPLKEYVNCNGGFDYALECAIGYKNIYAVKALLQFGADVNKLTASSKKRGGSLLTDAMDYGYVGKELQDDKHIIKLLLDYY